MYIQVQWIIKKYILDENGLNASVFDMWPLHKILQKWGLRGVNDWRRPERSLLFTPEDPDINQIESINRIELDELFAIRSRTCI